MTIAYFRLNNFRIFIQSESKKVVMHFYIQAKTEIFMTVKNDILRKEAGNKAALHERP